MNSLKMNAIIIIRGLPGSGKTSLAELLSENKKYPVFSVDQYFTDEEGNYSFDYKKNYLAYEHCIQNVLNEIKKKTKKIFVDNTFTLDWEMEPYFKMASEFKYMIFVFTVENYHGGKNIHGIPDEQLQKMAEKYKVQLLSK
jgi:deoxyadenosine/deoxycytidine kinase